MYKTLIFCLALFLFIAGCKKETKKPEYDIVGTWALLSFTQTNNKLYTSDEFPCLKSNLIDINSNGTTRNYYTGITMCYITPPLNGGASTTVGSPGQADNNATYTANGELFQMQRTLTNGTVKKNYAAISSNNGKLSLNFNDTTYNAGSTIITSSTYIKQ